VSPAVADRLIDSPGAAEALGVSARTVDRLAQQGYLTRLKVLRATRFKASEIERIIAEGTGEKQSDVERLAVRPAGPRAAR
jgi:predicted DNA-binding transcriptional regulator AlpA